MILILVLLAAVIANGVCVLLDPYNPVVLGNAFAGGLVLGVLIMIVAEAHCS